MSSGLFSDTSSKRQERCHPAVYSNQTTTRLAREHGFQKSNRKSLPKCRQTTFSLCLYNPQYPSPSLSHYNLWHRPASAVSARPFSPSICMYFHIPICPYLSMYLSSIDGSNDLSFCLSTVSIHLFFFLYIVLSILISYKVFIFMYFSSKGNSLLKQHCPPALFHHIFIIGNFAAIENTNSKLKSKSFYWYTGDLTRHQITGRKMHDYKFWMGASHNEWGQDDWQYRW